MGEKSPQKDRRAASGVFTTLAETEPRALDLVSAVALKAGRRMAAREWAR